MDLVAGANNIIVTMTHASKHGVSKLLNQCSLPLTGRGCIKKVLTDLAYIEIKSGKFHLVERAPGVSIADIIKLTEGELVINGDIPEMSF
jgi:3-oxoacid CoA-transferase subunit B